MSIFKHNTDEQPAPPEALTALARVVEEAATRAAAREVARQTEAVAHLEWRLAASIEGAERAQHMADAGADLIHALRAANEAQQIAGADCIVVGNFRIDMDGEPERIRIDLRDGSTYLMDGQALSHLRKGRYAALLLFYRKGDA